MKVVCADCSAEQGQAVADRIIAEGGEAIFVKTDCSNVNEVKELIDTTVEHYGKLDGIIEKYLPGFSKNEQAKAVYGMTFGAIAPVLGLPQEVTEGLLKELNEL